MAVHHTAETEKAQLLVGRLREFCDQRALWHRRLWNAGTVLGLREVAEYADACLSGTSPNTEGLRFVLETMRREVKRDPGVAHLAGQIENSFQDLDKSAPKEIRQAPIDQLRELIRRASTEYSVAWCNASKELPVEFTARAIASHLLDSGLSADHLYRWLHKRASDFATTADFVRATAEMFVEMQPQRFLVFVPCAAPYKKSATSSGDVEWLDAHEASKWLKESLPHQERRRHNGGFLVAVSTRDPWSAVAMARSVIARAAARVRVSRVHGHDLKFEGWACVAGSRQEFGLLPTYRPLEIGSLDRQDAVYRFDGAIAPEVDDALELASYMASPSPGAAITGGWSAVECLLLRPGEGRHYQAADRLAALIACSMPRAEMTALAYRHLEADDDALARSIERAETNFEKVQIVESHLASGHRLRLTRAADLAAQERILAVIGNPAPHLGGIRRYVSESLRRLYNQRNIIAHSGSFRSAALETTTRTSFSLVGAGLDRIVHAQLEQGDTATPLQLVARAENELSLAGGAGGRPLSSLLE